MDRENVIKGLEHCTNGGNGCFECPYSEDGFSATIYCKLQIDRDALTLLKEQEAVVLCKDCKHGSLYCTEDVNGEPLIECNRPDLGDVIEIHGWKWFCADGEKKGADK